MAKAQAAATAAMTISGCSAFCGLSDATGWQPRQPFLLCQHDGRLARKRRAFCPGCDASAAPAGCHQAVEDDIAVAQFGQLDHLRFGCIQHSSAAGQMTSTCVRVTLKACSASGMSNSAKDASQPHRSLRPRCICRRTDPRPGWCGCRFRIRRPEPSDSSAGAVPAPNGRCRGRRSPATIQIQSPRCMPGQHACR